MTRINLVEPKYLLDQHLIAEIKETNQLCGSFKRSANSNSGIVLSRIPKNFKLNSGHVYFFYNKGKYLHNRFESLKKEAIKRGFRIGVEFNNVWSGLPCLYNDWKPRTDDYYIIVERIIEKVSQKPDFYKYHKFPIILERYINVLRRV